MKKEILGLIIGISALSADAASIDYLNELYTGTVYAQTHTLLDQPQQVDIAGYMESLYADTAYTGSNLLQAQLSDADIAAENETNGYFQEWDQDVLSCNEENGYWM